MRRAVGVGLCQSNQKWACRTSNVLPVGCCSNVWLDRLDNKRPNSRRERGEFRLAFCSGATHLSINRNHSRILNLFINSPSLSPALLYSKARESRCSEFLRSVFGRRRDNLAVIDMIPPPVLILAVATDLQKHWLSSSTL